MAAKGVNKVILLGNVGRDPVIRHLSNGDAVASLAIATSEQWKDKTSGEKKEKTEWHRVSAFRKLAEIIEKYVHKGDKLYLEGKLQTSKWQNKEGVDVYTTEIIMDQMQMLGSSSGTKPAPKPAPTQTQVADEGFDDDIPF